MRKFSRVTPTFNKKLDIFCLNVRSVAEDQHQLQPLCDARFRNRTFFQILAEDDLRKFSFFL